MVSEWSSIKNCETTSRDVGALWHVLSELIKGSSIQQWAEITFGSLRTGTVFPRMIGKGNRNDKLLLGAEMKGLCLGMGRRIFRRYFKAWAAVPHDIFLHNHGTMKQVMSQNVRLWLRVWWDGRSRWTAGLFAATSYASRFKFYTFEDFKQYLSIYSLTIRDDLP